MPEYVRSLIVILALASIVFSLAKAPATAVAMSVEDFVRRRNAWYVITLAGFLSQSFWVFATVAAVTLVVTGKKEKNKIALFAFVLLAIPFVKVEIPGIAGIRYIIELDYLRILSIFLLLPLALECRRQAVKHKSKVTAPDIILALYIVYNVILVGRAGDLVAILRSAIGWTLDVAVPYYAISRSVRDIKAFGDVLMSLVVASMVSALVAVFEFLRSWMLYDAFGDALSINWTTGYLARGNFVRAVSTSSQAIVLGYVMTIAIGLYFYLYKHTNSKSNYILGLILLVAGVIAPLSKGPWIGLFVLVFVFLATGPAAVKNISKLASIVSLIGLLLLTTNPGGKIFDYLPFVGNVDEENISYRTNLIDVSLNAIEDNPIFGSTDFLSKMEDARNGAGLIDLVNHYIGVALNSGLVGLSMFVGFFGIVLYKLMANAGSNNNHSDHYLLARSLFSTLFAALIMISSVSAIYHVPVYYYMLAALSVALIKLQLSSVYVPIENVRVLATHAR